MWGYLLETYVQGLDWDDTVKEREVERCERYLGSRMNSIGNCVGRAEKREGVDTGCHWMPADTIH